MCPLRGFAPPKKCSGAPDNYPCFWLCMNLESAFLFTFSNILTIHVYIKEQNNKEQKFEL